MKKQSPLRHQLISERNPRKHAPSNTYARANQIPNMNKKLRKEIMKSSRLRNKFLNATSDPDRGKKQAK